MPEIIISGVPVNFPFQPYDLQKAYMTKVIECLQNETNGVLESPTGTGKTLSLLCSTLAWILTKKQQAKQFIQQQEQVLANSNNPTESLVNVNPSTSSLVVNNWGVPKVIYASRTHSQLTQAIQELKQSSYSFMKAIVLGSRDQLCIHPEVSKEPNNSSKIQLCKIHVTNRSCSFHSRIDSKKEHPEFKGQNIMDIEDLITIGRKLRMCPYFSSREVIPDADIVFMPYNYLLDPKARRANKVELNNTIVILDEAHNVEKTCEECASVQIKSSDIALAINDITQVMKKTSEDNDDIMDIMVEEPKDFSLDDLASLKEILLEFEKVVDSIEVKNKFEGITYPGGYIFELFEKANINFENINIIISLLDKIINFLAAASQKNAFFQNGVGLQVFSDFLSITFAGKTVEKEEKTFKSFKVHIEIQEIKRKQSTKQLADGWLNSSKANVSSVKMEKIINYWCFNAGYGMEELLKKNVRTIILTSGTLAPLKPLIAELGIPVAVRLENPHIVNKSQVCVKIISYGPDKERLISNYENRDNPKYINSLGGTISNFSSVIPGGLLVFFPSYVVMNKCIDTWKASGVWSQINKKKTVFVEPQGKDAFTTTMSEFYQKIQDSNSNGACFMAVCRGKVSEGLDFADMNGRAVIITGLPFPPFKDPRIILKRQYLESNRTKENELLSGQDWYSLEGARAVNQAIGRVIRHKNDYGAILFCDIRFQQPKQQAQLSTWIQGHLRHSIPNQNFGSILRELRQFFVNAKKTLPEPKLRENIIVNTITTINEFPPIELKRKAERSVEKSVKSRNNFIETEKLGIDLNWTAGNYSSSVTKSCTSINAMDFISRLDGNVSTINFNECCSMSNKDNNLQDAHHVENITSYACTSQQSPSERLAKRRKLKLVSNDSPLLAIPPIPSSVKENNELATEMTRKEFLDLIKNSLARENYVIFIRALMKYKNEETVENFFTILLKIFGTANSYHYLLKGIRRYIKENHKSRFDYLLAEFLKTN